MKVSLAPAFCALPPLTGPLSMGATRQNILQVLLNLRAFLGVPGRTILTFSVVASQKQGKLHISKSGQRLGKMLLCDWFHWEPLAKCLISDVETEPATSSNCL